MTSKIYIISGKNPLNVKSGYAVYAKNLAQVLLSLGLKVEVFCCDSKSKTIEKSEIGRVNVIGSRLLNLPFVKNREMTLFPILCLKMAYELRKKEKGIVWGIGPWSFTGILAQKRPFFSDYFTTIKHEFKATLDSMSIEDYGLFKRIENLIFYYLIAHLYSLFERVTLLYSDKIIIHYNSTQNILREEFGVTSKFIRLPYSIGKDKGIESRKNKKTVPLILLVSRHDGRKGINYLLKAFAILDKENIKYKALIIGKGRLFNANKKVSEKLGLKNVKLLGFVKNIELYLKKADIYAFPSIEEGSSAISLLEAMSFGLPIISTNVDGIKENLKNGQSAILVPPSNPTAITEAIRELIKNPALATRLGKEANLEFNYKYNYEKTRVSIRRFLQKNLQT